MANVQPQNSITPHNAMLVGLMVGTAGLAVGCEKPESGSLENARKPAKPAKIDYNKLDYSKVDVAKIDASKLDASKIDAAKLDMAKIDPAKLRFDEKQLTVLVDNNLKLASSKTMAAETVRRLEAAVGQVEDPKLAEQVKQLVELSKLAQAKIGEGVLRW